MLVIGDLHIPNRAADLPAKFKRLLVRPTWREPISRGPETLTRHPSLLTLTHVSLRPTLALSVSSDICVLIRRSGTRSVFLVLSNEGGVEGWADNHGLVRSSLPAGKIQSILCTGNVCDAETHEYLQSIAPEVHVVKGDSDEVRSLFPHTSPA